MDAIATRPVFLSYAREDADAARRIADALRSDRVEVWFDESQLRGGDAWDRKIRRKIKECALFLAIISTNTQRRGEGYFRLEWKLADQRTYLMGRAKPFLLPICVDDTSDSDADVPDSFLAVQWIRVPGGEVPAALVERVKTLLAFSAAPPVSSEQSFNSSHRSRAVKRSLGRVAATTGVLALIAFGALALWREHEGPSTSQPSPKSAASSEFPHDPDLSRAWRLIHNLNATSEDFALAEDIIKIVIARHPLYPEAAIVYAWHGIMTLNRNNEQNEERYSTTARYAERAMQLASDNPWAMTGMAGYLILRKADRHRAEQLARRAIAKNSNEPRFYQVLVATQLEKNPGDALATAEQAVSRFSNDALAHYALYQCYSTAGRIDDADRELDRALALAPAANLIIEKVQSAFIRGDIRGMKKFLDQIPDVGRLNGRVVFWSYVYAYVSLQPDYGLRVLKAFPGEWIRDKHFTGPKALLIGDLFLVQDKQELARGEYNLALNAVKRELALNPADLTVRLSEMWTLYRLDRMEDARSIAALLADGSRQYDNWALWFSQFRARLLLGERDWAVQFMKQSTSNDSNNRRVFRSIIWLDPRMIPFRNDAEMNALFTEPSQMSGSNTAPP